MDTEPSTLFLVSYDSFALITLLLITPAILLTSPSQIRKIAKVQDFGRTVSFLVVVGAACFSFVIGMTFQVSDVQIVSRSMR